MDQLTRIEREILTVAMERYRIWRDDHPEGPIPPGKPGGIAYQAGYDLIILCAEYQRQLDEQAASLPQPHAGEPK